MVISASGWDARYATVRALRAVGDVAIVLVDTNGDGREIELERYGWADGGRHPGDELGAHLGAGRDPRVG